MISKIEYTSKTASMEEIDSLLTKCTYDFVPPIHERVIIGAYSKKIYENAVTFEARIDTILIGLVAAYFNNRQTCSGFITSISIEHRYHRMGIGYKIDVRMSWICEKKSI